MNISAINVGNPSRGEFEAVVALAEATEVSLANSDLPRLLVIPGLRDSGPAHWQSRLQSLHSGAMRVRQRDWSLPDLDRWAARSANSETHAGGGPFIAAAHGFGCLALARHLAQQADSPIVAARFVAPADPDRFGVAAQLPLRHLAATSTVVASDTDPWMRAAQARRWAQRWGSHFINLGNAGHINAEAGYGPLPFAAVWVNTNLKQHTHQQRAEHAVIAETSFAE